MTKKQKIGYKPKTKDDGTHSLEKTWISKACVKQRSGRSGRTRPGMCFHIFSKIRFDSMILSSTPEILRVPLQELCLHTKIFSPADMEIANFLSLALQPPSSMAVQKAIQSLKSLGALDHEEKLTVLGKHLLQLSVEPHLGKMLIYAVIFKCLDPVLTIVACLNQKDPFILPSTAAQKSMASGKKKDMSEDTLSDHMSFLRAFQKWQEAKIHQREYQFCQDNFVSASAMHTIMQTRNQLMSQLRAEGFVSVMQRDSVHDVNMYAESWPVVKAAILSGLYPQLAFLEYGRLCTRTEKKVVCHISSCIHKQLNSKAAMTCWFMFDELSKVGSFSSIKCNSLITPATIGLVGGDVTEHEYGTSEFVIDDWISFEAENANYYLLRLALDKMIKEKVKNPKHVAHDDRQILDALSIILREEDTAAGLTQPEGIGSRPQFLHNRQNVRDDSRRNQAPAFNKRRYNQTNSNNPQFNKYDNRNNSYRNSPQPSKSGYDNRAFNGPSKFPQKNYQNRSNQGYNTEPFNRDMLPNRQNYNQNAPAMQGQNRTMPSTSEPSGSESNHYRLQYNQDTPQAFENQRSHNFGDRAGPSYNDQAKDVSSTLPPYAKYLFVKEHISANMDMAATRNIFVGPDTEYKIRNFLQEQKPVVLIFSPKSSGYFQGAARVLDVFHNSNCAIEWVSKKKICFSEVRDRTKVRLKLYNDGEELDPMVGEKICRTLIDLQ